MLLVCSKVKLSVIARFKVKREFNLKDVWVCITQSSLSTGILKFS